ncbi:BZ3500_MvSof-1268-A1-R1_Chr1-3g01848 [Microbotryum saponariae]|uniref:BZ3500_MvSof-1268-A1-R1_Chr1-3g01848 protein n=1 Tax=Microbotryum saponariae TaxID=289078 RepID=A0A2X0KBL9_9BASI|nr:BZ3500_MvSof-1268-A1-R1_Chr1-3g01848 [Microbotryum saponariae]SCZ94737.1 BZ3501_MvSof-1269-A2-R1_Chr1-3g01450 [Microbotryum saponariae]
MYIANGATVPAARAPLQRLKPAQHSCPLPDSTMALPPQFATHRIGSPSAAHTLELYLDLICPFSQKQLKGVRDHLIPRIEAGELPLQIILRQVPQPW